MLPGPGGPSIYFIKIQTNRSEKIILFNSTYKLFVIFAPFGIIIFLQFNQYFLKVFQTDLLPEDWHFQGPPSSPVGTKHLLCQTPEQRNQ